MQTLARCDVFIRRKCRALPMMTQGGQERRAWWCPEKWSVHQSSIRDAYKVVDDVDIFLVCYCQYCLFFGQFLSFTVAVGATHKLTDKRLLRRCALTSSGLYVDLVVFFKVVAKGCSICSLVWQFLTRIWQSRRWWETRTLHVLVWSGLNCGKPSTAVSATGPWG